MKQMLVELAALNKEIRYNDSKGYKNIAKALREEYEVQKEDVQEALYTMGVEQKQWGKLVEDLVEAINHGRT